MFDSLSFSSPLCFSHSHTSPVVYPFCLLVIALLCWTWFPQRRVHKEESVAKSSRRPHVNWENKLSTVSSRLSSAGGAGKALALPPLSPSELIGWVHCRFKPCWCPRRCKHMQCIQESAQSLGYSTHIKEVSMEDADLSEKSLSNSLAILLIWSQLHIISLPSTDNPGFSLQRKQTLFSILFFLLRLPYFVSSENRDMVLQQFSSQRQHAASSITFHSCCSRQQSCACSLIYQRVVSRGIWNGDIPSNGEFLAHAKQNCPPHLWVIINVLSLKFLWVLNLLCASNNTYCVKHLLCPIHYFM